MRYQIRARTREIYDSVVALLHNEASVHAESRRRLSVAASDVSDGLRARLEAMGATVAPDRQFDLDPVPR